MMRKQMMMAMMVLSYLKRKKNLTVIMYLKLINNSKILIKFNILTFNNQQFSEIMKNSLNEIRQEIKGIVNGKYIDTVYRN